MFEYLIRGAKRGYSSSLFLEKLFQKVTSSGFYSGLVKSRIEKQRVKDEKGPFNLVIETSNFCNARCVMCPYRIMKRPKKIMEKKVFNKIIERILKEKLFISPETNLFINKVFLSGMGEPLIDPDLISRIRKFKEIGLAVRLYTNASLLNEKMAQELVDIGLDEINISFNGATAKQYKKVMGLNFKKTVKNINALIKLRKEAGSKLPVIQISLVAGKENEKDIKNYLKSWARKVDSVTVTKPHQWGGGVAVNSSFGFQKNGLIYPCRSLWHTFVIDSRGNFVICCRDYESKHVLGNVEVDSFADIRKKLILKRFQKKHLAYSQKKLPKICQQCNFPYQGGVEWFIPRSLD